MDEQPTCGKGLAANSAIPAKIAELIASLTATLEAHLDSLVATDDNTEAEREAYQRLAREYRQISEQLQTTARAMAGYRDLPPAEHDEQALATPRMLRAFESYVRAEKQLFNLLRDSLEADEPMLAEMKEHIDQ